MKKLFLATLAVSLLSISAFAVDGKVGMIRTDQPNDRIIVGIVDADGNELAAKVLQGNADQVKAALALVLTAKSTNADVSFGTQGGTGGTWTNIILK